MEVMSAGAPARIFPAASSRAARISARRATAYAIGPPRASPRRSIPRPATSAFAASSATTAEKAEARARSRRPRDAALARQRHQLRELRRDAVPDQLDVVQRIEIPE